MCNQSANNSGQFAPRVACCLPGGFLPPAGWLCFVSKTQWAALCFGSLSLLILSAAAQEQPKANAAQQIEQLLLEAEKHEAKFDFAAATKSLLEAEQQSTAQFGGDHPLTLSILNRLGTLYYTTGQYEQAETKLSQAVEISRRIFGPADPEHLTCVNNLAALWHAQGRYAQALPRLLEVAQEIERQYGQKHPHYASALNNLAGLDQSLGDYQRATERLRQALAIRQAALGADHEDTLTSLNNLAGLYLQTGQPQEARQLFADVLKARQARGADHPDCATALSNLAAAEEALQNLPAAEQLLREALAQSERVLGPDHPTVATNLNNLGLLLDARQQPAEAEKLLRRALKIRGDHVGKLHPDYAASLNNLAVHFRQSGQPAAAANWYRQALAAHQAIIEATLPALSERQQLSHLANLRRTLDGFLSIAAAARLEPGEVYQHVLWWKGQVLVRQLARRQAASGSAAAPLVDQLRVVCGQLAALALTPPAGDTPAVREQRIQSLSRQREQLESKIAELASAAGEKLAASPSELAASLPPGVVLIDFLEYWRTAQDGIAPRTELTAFIIKPAAPIARLEFGPTESLAETIATWLRTQGAPGPAADAGAELRERLWLPLAPHVARASVVLTSPDGCLTRLPLAALPGTQPGTYLLEEQTIVIAPVPQLLPSLFAGPLAGPSREPSLLLVGDIDYGQPSEAASRQSAEQLNFASLAAARSEILAVRDSFERAFPAAPAPAVLRGAAATEEAFRRQSSSPQFIHVVTHGFVSRQSAAREPFVLERTCGLAFAGANSPRDQSADDGLLTAAEAASFNLRGARLVVLSACETGLGTVAAGEGVLGLQRAFQAAGAQSVIASLWKVDDRATQQLMDLFYEKLWSSGGRLSRIEALRQAQLAILRGHYERGVGIVKKTPDQQQTPPYYWAAFILSGDWR